MRSPHRLTLPCLLGAALAACAGEHEATPKGLEIAVAPLSLPNVSKVCYDILVTNGPDKTGDAVWSKGTPGLNGGVADSDAICSTRYGNLGGGDVAYVGPCDADGQEDPSDAAGERTNSVTIWFDGIYDSAGAYVAPDGAQGWQNPCLDQAGDEVGCTLNVLCEENADAEVEFNFTILRDANQGFFDVAVNFEDIFCSAKLDCRPELLHRGNTRDATAVVAFACASGVRERTILQASDLTLTCDGLVPVVLPATAAPGQYGAAPGVFAWAVYRGDEELTSGGEPLAKCYWNRAVGLDEVALAGRSCRLSGVATASRDGIVPPVGSTVYPVVRFDVEVLASGGALCGPNPLNGPTSGVVTDYLTPQRPLGATEQLTASFSCSTCGSDVDTICNGLDDDCDGETDEDYVATSTSCGAGVCAANGFLTCQGGVLVDTCTEGSPASWTNTFDALDDADDVHVSVYRAGQFCDDITGTGPGLTCAPEPGFRATGGHSGGYVFGTAEDNSLRHYGLTVGTVPRPNLLGGRISGHFRTFKQDLSGPGSVKAAEGASNLAANATTSTARARWIITARNPTTNAIWIWVSRDDFAWNPNDDTSWTEHGIDLDWANFAQWLPFMTNTYAGGSPAEFADSIQNVIRIGVIMSDASIVYGSHLHSSWYRSQRYGVMSATPPAPIELGWDQLTLSATGNDCNTNGLDDDCNGVVDDCPGSP